MTEYPPVRCPTCNAVPLAPCVENGREVECHGSRRMIAMWRSAVGAVTEASEDTAVKQSTDAVVVYDVVAPGDTNGGS